MVFIGMKVQVPTINELKLFIPIFSRRAISLYFTIISQLFMKSDEKIFRTNIVFFNAADSIWPYVHLMSIYDNKYIQDQIDAGFMLNKVAVDYALAVFLNMIFSTFKFTIFQ